jgi:hypothetical protein
MPFMTKALICSGAVYLTYILSSPGPWGSIVVGPEPVPDDHVSPVMEVLRRHQVNVHFASSVPAAKARCDARHADISALTFRADGSSLSSAGMPFVVICDHRRAEYHWGRTIRHEAVHVAQYCNSGSLGVDPGAYSAAAKEMVEYYAAENIQPMPPITATLEKEAFTLQNMDDIDIARLVERFCN